MKQQLLTTIAAVLLVGCGPSIHQTVIDGNEALLRRELSNGANVNEKNEDGYTPLHLAAQSGHKRIVELLIDKGSDVNAKNDDGDTPLDVAIKFKHPKIADLLRKPLNKFWFQYNGQQEPGFRLWERDDNGIWTETYPSGHQSKFKEDGIDKVDGLVGDYVVKLSGDIEKTGTQDGGFRVFIPHYQKKESFLYFSQKSSGNWTDWKETNYSIIVLTTRDGGKVEDMPEEIAALLRKQGAKTAEELNTPSRRSQAAGTRAPVLSQKNARPKSFPKTTKELMFGANPTLTDKDKAFLSAAKEGKLDEVKSLLEEGVDIDCYDAYACTALFWAAANNHINTVELLIDKGAYIDAGAGIGGTPLGRAAYEGHVEVVELLIEHGANVNAKDGTGGSVLDAADDSVAEILRKNGAR